MADESNSSEEFSYEDLPGVERYLNDLGEEGLERMLEMVGDFSEELQHNWSRIRKKNYNSSKKGDEFEKTLKEYLASYFSSAYEFRRGRALLDSELRCLKEYTGKENEFDVVASFRTAIPNVVFEEGDMEWVPYDGVAFLCEVKSGLSKSALKSDLEKLETLVDLRGDPSDRFGVRASGGLGVAHQLHCLVYDENRINQSTRDELLDKYPDAWDLMLIVEEDKLLINSTLPIAGTLFGKEKEDASFTWCHIDNGLLWFVVALAASIQRPVSVDTTRPMIKMANFTGVSTGGGRFRYDTD